MSKQEIAEKIIPILKKQGVKKAALFGSQARGEAKKNSDVDLLVELPKRFGLFEMGGLKMDLEEALNKKVDLVEYSVIHPLLKEQILKEQIAIL
ncbi:MAG: nucleotidyltransferase family protein [Candidatus Pacebacteria bacterium]|nr:nucleotidyltransferase family protein [Candidatus Paceibacterota bacterium]